MASSTSTSSTTPRETRVLLVDDEPEVTRAIQVALRKQPFSLECADSGARALELLAARPFDAVVSDERMPGMPGSELLTIVRERHPDTARIILSGQASVEAAVAAINSAQIFRFLIKPCAAEEIALTIREALAARDEKRRFEAWSAAQASQHAESVSRIFERALASLWIGQQPIFEARTNRLCGFEALLRSDDPEFAEPPCFFALARRLGRAAEAGRHVRLLTAESIERVPTNALVFVNVNPEELADERLLDGRDEIARFASRVVLEITERESLTSQTNLVGVVGRLREQGFRIALDDLGAGYSGLTSLALVLPDLVKFDMDLVRGIDLSPTKRTLVASLVAMCSKLGIRTLAEGVESPSERDTLESLGCDFLQGFLLGRPSRTFSTAPISGEPACVDSNFIRRV